MSLRKSLLATVLLSAVAGPAIAVDVALPSIPGVVVATSAAAEQTAPSTPPTAPTQSDAAPQATPVPTSHLPAPPQIPPAVAPYQDLDTFLSRISPQMREEFRNYELETWRIRLMAERAAALRALCADGYGPADRCAQSQSKPANSSVSTDQSMNARPDLGLPTPYLISGSGNSRTATLRYNNGQFVDVYPRRGKIPGTILPTGEEVIAVSNNAVVIGTPNGANTTLPYPIGQ